MESSSHVFLLSTIFMLLISHSMAANAPSELVEDVCTATENLMVAYGERLKDVAKYDVCVDVLQLDPRTASANATTLAEISIQLAISSTTNTQTLIENLLGNTTPALRKPLETCLSSYKDVTSHLKKALLGLTADLLSANYNTVHILESVKTCEHALAENKVHIHVPLAPRNHYTCLLAEISQILVARLELYHIGSNLTRTRTQA